MPNFSKSSQDKLQTCNPALQVLFKEVIKHFDCTVTEGHRSPERQEELFKAGKSKVRLGKHNTMPSRAIDVAPYPIDYDDIRRIGYFAGNVMGIAKAMGISLRWGGDWDRDTEVKDQTFNDLVHFETMEV